MSDVSDDEIEQITGLFEIGCTPKEVSGFLGAHYQAVLNERKKWQIKKNGYGSIWEYHRSLLNRKGLTQTQYRSILAKKKLVRCLEETPLLGRYGKDTIQKIADEYWTVKDNFRIEREDNSALLSVVSCRVLRDIGEVATFKDMCQIFSAGKWKSMELYRRVYGEEIKPNDTESFIKKAVSDFEIPSPLESRITDFYRKNLKLLLMHKPNSRAVACVYSVAKNYVGKRELCTSLSVTDVTLNNILNDLNRK